MKPGHSRTVVVTGASGFLGTHVCRELVDRGDTVRGLSRTPIPDPRVEHFPLDGQSRHLQAAMQGADAVVHLAARVHVRGRPEVDALQQYQQVNVEMTERIATSAAATGVTEFLFASSVKAGAEHSLGRLCEDDPPRPGTPYGASKLQAEQVVADIGRAAGMATASIRLPLVYGEGMKANMLTLFRAVSTGLPLPLGNIANRRSLLYAGNAAAAFAGLLGRLDGQELFYLSDGEDVSTSELLRRIGSALGRHTILLPAPVGSLKLLSRVGRGVGEGILSRLFDSLAVDSARILQRLSKSLPYDMNSGLKKTADWYLDSASQ